MIARTLLDEILAPGGLSILFQPIVELGNGKYSIFALEALSRGPQHSNLERADVLFEYVRRKGRETDVDHACIDAALAAAAPFPGSPAISINVHASTLERDEGFSQFVTDACLRHGISISRVILEIVEQQKPWDERRFFETVATLRSHGVRIAVDDIGLGYSNYHLLIEIRPDFFKVDRYFVDHSHEKPGARAAIESIVFLASRLGGRVVAEGIEAADDLQAVTALGVDLLQGYYFQRPCAPEAMVTSLAHLQANKGFTPSAQQGC
jgi:EAL domain-containing protein (putative c-di-GMP-specific phosphodiesterase class I)